MIGVTRPYTHFSPPRYNIRHPLWCLLMFVTESVRPRFGHAFSLGKHVSPQVLHFFSPHPLPHLPCRLSQVLLYLSLIFSYRTSSTSAPRPPHTFSWFTFVFSLWKLSTLRVSSFCVCPGLPCSCKSFQIHHTGMPRRIASLYSSLQSSPPPPDNLCSSLTA